MNSLFLILCSEIIVLQKMKSLNYMIQGLQENEKDAESQC